MSDFQLCVSLAVQMISCSVAACGKCSERGLVVRGWETTEVRRRRFRCISFFIEEFLKRPVVDESMQLVHLLGNSQVALSRTLLSDVRVQRLVFKGEGRRPRVVVFL